jgi:hypothetical protein
MTQELTIYELEKTLGSKERVLFYLTWLKHERNATQAYLELHPKVSEHSARTLGSRMLANIDVKVIANAYGLDHQSYFKQLREGVDATKRDQLTGEVEPDHKARLPYHTKLGKLLGIEDNAANQIQVNILNHFQKERDEFE